MAAELTLVELCKAFDVSQEELAKILGVKQTNVSKVERREDMWLSTLVTYVRAIGGDMEIIAHFPNRGGARTRPSS
jgi:transcriptional regulator with XRE-family HTH domain